MSDSLFDTKGSRFYYWTLPIIVMVPQIIMYFSGVRWMVEIVCPSVNREFGTIENLQLVTILFMAIVCFYGALRKTALIEKAGFALLTIFSLLVLGEEMDWGAHFVQYYTGEKSTFFSRFVGETNIHNQEGNAKWFKRPVYPIMILLFIVFPYFREKLKHPFLQYITPKKLIIGTAIITLFSDLIPRYIVKLNIRPDAGLGVNIGEFSEVMVYYIFALYLYEIVFEKTFEWSSFRRNSATS
jgi:hypothetical protein